MCRRIECPECGRPGFAGCGMHVERVLSGVPREERCRCHETPASKVGAPDRSTTSARAGRSLLDRVLRVALGLVLLTLTQFGPHTPWGYLGLIPLLTGIVGFCPVYRLFGADTRSSKT